MIKIKQFVKNNIVNRFNVHLSKVIEKIKCKNQENDYERKYKN